MVTETTERYWQLRKPIDHIRVDLAVTADLLAAGLWWAVWRSDPDAAERALTGDTDGLQQKVNAVWRTQIQQEARTLLTNHGQVGAAEQAAEILDDLGVEGRGILTHRMQALWRDLGW